MTIWPRHPFRALASGLTAQKRQGDPEIFVQASRVLAFSLSMFLWVPVFAVVYMVLDSPIGANVVLLGGPLILGIILLLARGVAPATCGNLLTGAAWYVYTALTIITGGLWSPVMVWYATLPILSILLCGNRSGWFWTWVGVATVTFLAAIELTGIPLPTQVSGDAMPWLQSTGLVGLLLCVYLLVSVLKKMEFGVRHALHEANAKLEFQALTDGLTGIPNRQCFDEVLAQEWKRHERTSQPLSLVLIDADFFKDYNDEYGHLAGDDCLRAIARTLQSSIHRPGDFCARFGGEEFVAILPDTDRHGARRVADAIRMHMRVLAIPHGHSTVSRFVTVSIGISTTVPAEDRSPLDFLHEVDMALYRAKDEGRDRIAEAVCGEAEAIET